MWRRVLSRRMRKVVGASMTGLLVLLAPPASLSESPSATRASDVLRLKRFEIIDPVGFDRPVAAVTLLAPSDWVLEGGVQWNANWSCQTDMVRVQARVRSPDGTVGLELFPLYSAEWMDDPYGRELHMQSLQLGHKACPLKPPIDAATFVTQVLMPAFRQGAQVLRQEARPSVTRAALAKVQRNYGPLLAQMGARVQGDAARVRVGYSLASGPTEEWLIATAFVTTSQTLAPSAALQGGMGMQNHYTTGVENIYGFWAPADQLDTNEKLFSTILASVRVNPAWQAAIINLIVNINRIQLQGTIDRARIWRDAMNEIGETQMRTWRSSSDTLDRVATSWSQTMRGVATYYDAQTSTSVELTDGYTDVWTYGGDEYILTRDPSFDPNRTFSNQNWRRMQRRD